MYPLIETLSLANLAAIMIAACILVAVTRLTARWFIVPEIINPDTYIHMCVIRRLRTARGGWWASSQLTLPGYPKFFHWLVSRVWVGSVASWEKCNGALWDGCHVALFLVVLAVAAPASWPSFLYVWLPILLAISPAWLAFGLGPRTYFATERVFGEFVAGVLFCATWLAVEFNSPWAWLAAAVLGGVLLNSSKFGAQVLLAFCLILGALLGIWQFAALPIASFLFAQLFSRGGYLRILKYQVRHLTWYVGAVRTGGISVGGRNTWSLLRTRVAEHGIVGLLRYVTRENSYIIAASRHAPLIAVLLWTWSEGTVPTWDFPTMWLAAAAAVFLVTSLRKFLFLGEAERYLLHASVAEYFVIGDLIARSGSYWLLYAILTYSLLWWVVQMAGLKKFRAIFASPSDEPDWRAMCDFLETLPARTLYPVGQWYFAWKTAYHTKHNHYVMHDDFAEKCTANNEFDNYLAPRYAIVGQLGPGWILVEQSYVNRCKQSGKVIDFPLGDLRKLYANDRYAVFAADTQSVTEGEHLETAAAPSRRETPTPLETEVPAP